MVEIFHHDVTVTMCYYVALNATFEHRFLCSVSKITKPKRSLLALVALGFELSVRLATGDDSIQLTVQNKICFNFGFFDFFKKRNSESISTIIFFCCVPLSLVCCSCHLFSHFFLAEFGGFVDTASILEFIDSGRNVLLTGAGETGRAMYATRQNSQRVSIHTTLLRTAASLANKTICAFPFVKRLLLRSTVCLGAAGSFTAMAMRLWTTAVFMHRTTMAHTRWSTPTRNSNRPTSVNKKNVLFDWVDWFAGGTHFWYQKNNENVVSRNWFAYSELALRFGSL